MADRGEGCKGITLAGAVGLRFKEGLEEFGGVGNEGLGVLENRGDCPGGILSYIGMAVFQTRAGRGQEGLDEFGLAEFAQETESVSTDIFVRVLQVITDAIATNVLVYGEHAGYEASLPNQDHLLLQLARGVVLGADFIVEI